VSEPSHPDPYGATVAAPSAAPLESGRAPLPRIGRFVLLRKIGQGGMGTVFVGYDETLDRRVAVKVLHRGAASAQWLLREAQALAKLSHPNVVPLYEIGEHEGRVFLAMEYVRGDTLRAHLASGKSGQESVLRLFLQAGRGLVAAHDAGLVHRDFKPDNVLVGNDGRARVVDFGIAALSDREELPRISHLPGTPISASPSALATPMTQTGALMGTPAFMSPEQFRGERATAKSDQFSFCVALYAAAYGQRPFEGEGLIEVAQNVAAGALQPPPDFHTAPDWLWGLLARGLTVDPEQRFPTLTALLDAIEAKLPRDPDLDPSTTRHERRAAFGVLFGNWAVTGAYVASQGTKALATPWRLVGLSASFLVVCVAMIAILWKRLKKNLFGRQLAALIICTPATLVVHRLVAGKLGTPVYHILTVDILIVTCLFTIAAFVVERRLLAVTVVGLFATVLAAYNPSYSPYAFSALGLLGLAIGVYVSDAPR
jgi:eukaryotic-like serine/threonine-protein kinase